MPEPQRVSLQGSDFPFSSAWRLSLGQGVSESSSAVESLSTDLKERHQIILDARSGAGAVLELTVVPGSVVPGPSQDRDREAIAAQAYRLELAPSHIRIVANTETGLFYGVQTLVQLLKPRSGTFWLPEGEIVDWPDLQDRHIYWDDAHHLEKLSELKRAVRQAASFKINGFIVKLEGHFQFKGAAALVEPQALAPAELQELTDYGLRYHVQVIPYLDAPAHISFILKHPEFANLRAFPASNYEMCVTNPDTFRLLFGMYDELLAANKGVSHFYLSTDEAYYVGLSNQNGCTETQRAKELGSVGKVLAEFVTKAAGYLHDHGRTAVFWGEYPLKPDDISSLPSYIINGETYGDRFDPLYKAHGMRQMIYSSTEGEERLFPHYFLRPTDQRLHELYEDYERIPTSLAQISADPARKNSDLMGLVIAGWGDMGLHPETFWLGYAVITSSGWRMWSAGPREATSSFYPLFYGPAEGMDRVYRLMSYQSQLWTDSWETIDSHARKPIWGNSYSIFEKPQPAHDQTLKLPGSLSADLHYTADWAKDHDRLLRLVAEALPENDELQGLLGANLLSVTSNRYNLEVFLSIAQLCSQNLEMLISLKRIEELLKQADRLARAGKASQSVEAVDQALTEARAIRKGRNGALSAAVATWYKAWLPRAEQANGRRFLHQVDDVKDHLPDRTIDMSYLVYRELELPFEAWYRQVQTARNTYAEVHHLPQENISLRWLDLE